MMEESYISLETAKLLKEKGFKEITQVIINSDGDIWMWPYGSGEYELGENRFPYPTQSLAMKWLREKYNLFVVPKPDFYGGFFTGRIYDGNKESNTDKNDYIACSGCSTYEEAAEAAIKYCLEHLI